MFDRSEYQRPYQRKWLKERKEKYKPILGTCMFCGTAENIEMHHIDPKKKESHKIWSWSKERLLDELKQCVGMCHACHKKFHDLLQRKPLVHGTLHGYHKYGCRCDACKKARADYYREKERPGRFL